MSLIYSRSGYATPGHKLLQSQHDGVLAKDNCCWARGTQCLGKPEQLRLIRSAKQTNRQVFLS